ncbi:MAG: CPBP family intramembrane metalloprotease [Thermoguttaceae bacterium]|nr:CPBP family intramembrane metalloprotease [Thermoguttaceae bacterium]
MRERFRDYWQRSRTPLASLLFILPLLVSYELGIRLMNHSLAQSGGGLWLRRLLQGQFHMPAWGMPLLPVTTLLLLHLWCYRKTEESRSAQTPNTTNTPYLTNAASVTSESYPMVPSGPVAPQKTAVTAIKTSPATQKSVVASPLGRGRWLTIFPDMLIESVIWAMMLRGLLSVEQRISEMIWQTGPLFQTPPIESIQLGAAMLISHLGAGIYEEYLFRLLLVGGLAVMLRQNIREKIAFGTAILIGAIVFVIAHYLGTYGEPFLWHDAACQLAIGFRFTAAILLGVIFWRRGFGIAVGAHICYNLLVLIPLSF